MNLRKEIKYILIKDLSRGIISFKTLNLSLLSSLNLKSRVDH